MTRVRCTFVPPYLLERVAGAGGGSPASRTLLVDDLLRGRRTAGVADAVVAEEDRAWVVHTAGNGEDLPGVVVRRAGDPATGDPAVNEAGAGVSGALALLGEVYERDSYDDAGAPVVVTVHYGRDYANAFWDGAQLVFGDGDGEVFDRFTKAVDVLGHELAHAVTEHSAGLEYHDQPGALNESFSDVFAACLKQRLRAQTAAEADWLVGEGIFLPSVQARALRDMAAPGTAYDDPRLGRDPQPAHLDDYVTGPADNGGVHVNSGIPNRAFVLAARAIGGTSWDGAGRVWYAALTSRAVGPTTDFAGFAAATVAAAGAHADVVHAAWEEVGVVPAYGGAVPAGPVSAAAGGGTVRVRRSGGFAGLVSEAALDLDADDPDGEVRTLLGRCDLRAVAPGKPAPDRFVYEVATPDQHAVLHEGALTGDLRRLVTLVLERGRPGTSA